MATTSPRDPIIRLDGARLRASREAHGLKQAELAHATHYSPDYIYKIEAGINIPTDLGTIARLALAVGKHPAELVRRDMAGQAYVTESGRQVLDITPSLVLATLAQEGVYQITWDDILQLIAAKESVRLSTELQDELHITRSGLWHKAEVQGFSELARFARGSREWAKMTLRHCAWMCQQAGCPTIASAYIDEVEQYYPPVATGETAETSSDPEIRAQIALQRGWIQQQQYAAYNRACGLLTTAAKSAEDAHTRSTAHALLLCTEMERAQTAGQAWVAAVPKRALSAALRTQLVRSLHEDWQLSYDFDPENPHTAYQRFTVGCLLGNESVATVRAQQRLSNLARDSGTDHIWYLHLGRYYVSLGDWTRAKGFATDALYGYAQAGFPLGIAFAAAIKARAMSGAGLRTKTDWHLFLDLCLLVILCHGYATHPLARASQRALHQAVEYLAQHHPTWLQAYTSDVNARVLAPQKVGAFQALHKVRPEALTLSPRVTPRDYLSEWPPSPEVPSSPDDQSRITH